MDSEALSDSDPQHMPPGWDLPLLWIFSILVGGLILPDLLPLLVPAIYMPPDQGRLLPAAILGAGLGVLCGGFVGAVVGLIQWFALRLYVSWASAWVLITAAGWVIAGALAVDVLLFRLSRLDDPLTWVSGAGIIGAAQWLFLQRKMRGAGWWFAASVLGWVPGFAVVFLVQVVAPTTFAQPGLGSVWFAGFVLLVSIALVAGLTMQGLIVHAYWHTVSSPTPNP